MSFTVRTSGRVFCVRFERVPMPEDLEQLLKALHSRVAKLGTTLHYVGVIPEGVGVPTGMQRHVLANFGERATPYVGAVHLVLEGSGFKHSVQRSVVTAIYVLKPGKIRVSCHAHVEGAATVIAKNLNMEAAALVAALCEPVEKSAVGGSG